jgi:hypothetical protein
MANMLEEHFLAAGMLEKARDGAFRDGFAFRFVVLCPKRYVKEIHRAHRDGTPYNRDAQYSHDVLSPDPPLLHPLHPLHPSPFCPLSSIPTPTRKRLYYFRPREEDNDFMTECRGSLPCADILKVTSRQVEDPEMAKRGQESHLIEITVPHGKLRKEKGLFSGARDKTGNSKIVFRTHEKDVATDWAQVIGGAAGRARRRSDSEDDHTGGGTPGGGGGRTSPRTSGAESGGESGVRKQLKKTFPKAHHALERVEAALQQRTSSEADHGIHRKKTTGLFRGRLPPEEGEKGDEEEEEEAAAASGVCSEVGL